MVSLSYTDAGTSAPIDGKFASSGGLSKIGTYGQLVVVPMAGAEDVGPQEPQTGGVDTTPPEVEMELVGVAGTVSIGGTADHGPTAFAPQGIVTTIISRKATPWPLVNRCLERSWTKQP